MKNFLSEVSLMILVAVLELLSLAIAASMMAITVFIAWDVVISPVLGFPTLTLGQIFICAWAFLFCIFCADQVHYYFNPNNTYEVEVEETTKEKEGDDNDKKS